MANVGDVESMAGYAIEILQNDAKLEEMKDAAFAQAERFDISNIIPQYENIYRKYCRLDPCV